MYYYETDRTEFPREIHGASCSEEAVCAARLQARVRGEELLIVYAESEDGNMVTLFENIPQMYCPRG